MTLEALDTGKLTSCWGRFENLGNIFSDKEVHRPKRFHLPVWTSSPENLIKTPSFHGMKCLLSTNFCNYEQYKFGHVFLAYFFINSNLTTVKPFHIVCDPTCYMSISIIDCFRILPQVNPQSFTLSNSSSKYFQIFLNIAIIVHI